MPYLYTLNEVSIQLVSSASEETVIEQFLTKGKA